MEGARRRYTMGSFLVTLEEVHELLDLYSVDEIQERMEAGSFDPDLCKAIAPYLTTRITSGNLHANATEDPD